MITEEQLAKLHDVKVKEVADPTSRFSHEVVCSCGVRGLFYSLEEAEKYKKFHLDRKRFFPY